MTLPVKDTLPGTFALRARTLEKEIALRVKRDGQWTDITWGEYGRAAARVALTLKEMGLAKGDTVCILSENAPRWMITDHGVMLAGGATVPVYPSLLPHQVRYIVKHCEALLLFAQNEKQVKKVLEIIGETDLQQVVCFDDTYKPTDSRVITFADFLAKHPAEPSLHDLEFLAAGVAPSDVATISYTSGTTADPKGAVISHGNIMAMGNSMLKVLPLEREETISFLPLSHIAERLQGVVAGTIGGNQVSFAESLEKLKENLVEVRPTVLVCVPRLYEKFYAGIKQNVEQAGGFKRMVFNWALATGDEVRRQRNEQGAEPSGWLAWKWGRAQKMVVEPLKAKLGLDRCRLLISGAAPLSAEVSRFFGSLGMDIEEVYGQTECTGVCTMTPIGRVKPGKVGIACPDIEVKIAEDGEILVRGGNVFQGYLKEAKATAETVVDGWLHTGDVGQFDEDKYLQITDRKKDIIVTAGGKNVAPQPIENRIKTCPGVSQAVVVGDKRKFLVALITLDAGALATLTQIAGVDPAQATTTAPFVDNDKVKAHIRQWIDTVNKDLASYESIKDFRILPADFSIDSGEMTPSLKIKRRVIQKNHEAVIDTMYPPDAGD